MDPEKKWTSELPKRMFVDDAMWFVVHVEGMYMVICTSSDPNDEFILIENSYNVFEGPNCIMADKDTGKVERATYDPFHEFAPISPKLMIVLKASYYQSWRRMQTQISSIGEKLYIVQSKKRPVQWRQSRYWLIFPLQRPKTIIARLSMVGGGSILVKQVRENRTIDSIFNTFQLARNTLKTSMRYCSIMPL